MKILMVVSEVAPFVKTGGLGDVAGALPKALKELGHDVRIITPQYREVNERKYILRDVIRLQDIPVKIDKQTLEISVKSAFLPNSKVQVYFLDYKPYFFRKGLYVDESKGGEAYADNDKRYILFSKGVLETLKKLQWQPDVIHCNDWQTGLVPLMIKARGENDAFFKKISTLMSVHNFAFQGNFEPGFLSTLECDVYASEFEKFKVNGHYSFLKAGLVFADQVNTVSKNHVKETKTSEEFGFGLSGLLKSRGNDYTGIVNGIDDSLWNPEVDPFIHSQYTVKEINIKKENKKALFDKCQINASLESPCLSIISRLADQKGFDWLSQIFDTLMKKDLVFILLGVGDARYHQFFTRMQKKYPDKVSVHLTFDDQLAHEIIAGSDIFLMPSKFEPCGLTQLYSLKYGTVPVVNATGGLVDTVHSYDFETGKGNGFLMTAPNENELLHQINLALELYQDSKSWLKMMKSGMREDFSWQNSAKKYIQLYGKCLTRRKDS